MPADSSALLSLIVSQTRQNVEFLMEHNEISSSAGRDILSRLPSTNDIAVRELSEQTRRMAIPSPSPPVEPGPQSGPPIRRIEQPPPSLQRARALWAYNENGSEPNDLSFRPGDIIEVIAETNADWWTGRVNGKQGLFPSNYVEKVPASPPSYPPPNEVRGVSPAPAPVPYHSGPPAPYQPVYNGPPPGGYQSPSPQPYNPYLGPPMQPQPQTAVVEAQPAQPAQPAKPSRMGGMGRLLATSAVGGVGFGAGSAVGSGIVGAIF